MMLVWGTQTFLGFKLRLHMHPGLAGGLSRGCNILPERDRKGGGHA